jgi:hypothetical protein
VDTRPLGLVYAENINNYLKACWNLGVPSSSLFIASDLSLGKGITQVIQNVYALVKIAISQPE